MVDAWFLYKCLKEKLKNLIIEKYVKVLFCEKL